MNRVQANQFVPSMFIEQEPQMPSRHERRKVSVESISLAAIRQSFLALGSDATRSHGVARLRIG